MTSPEPWPRIAVVGAGAVGGYFGGLLARAGAPVVMIGRPAFVEAVKKHGLFLDTLHFQDFQGHDRKKHVYIDVRDDGFDRHRGMLSKIF